MKRRSHNHTQCSVNGAFPNRDSTMQPKSVVYCFRNTFRYFLRSRSLLIVMTDGRPAQQYHTRGLYVEWPIRTTTEFSVASCRTHRTSSSTERPTAVLGDLTTKILCPGKLHKPFLSKLVKPTTFQQKRASTKKDFQNIQHQFQASL